MTETKQLTLPITGMTCANCVAAVERNIKKVDGVQVANVNLSSERATIEYDPNQAGLDEFLARIDRAGFGVASGEADFMIQRMSDDNDARSLENVLSQSDGVTSAQVNFANERAKVTYIPTIVSQSELRRAVKDAGFDVVVLGGEAEDAERKAREAEIAQQRHFLTVGLVFTVPLFLFSMGRDF
ncbi:MAG: heavy-metal-associated domain-containing protein, partial [Anaerolineales bacterium]|nr:heavy-metal-associated domain-containing protein [Anaerolineales bacterium]